MIDFEVQKFTRRCFATERELQPGEAFHSVLIPDGEKVIRRDYSVEAWQGPPENAIGSWRAEVPDPRANRVRWAPNEVMLQLFVELYENPAQRDFCYVLTLLLIRRRLFKLENSERDAEGNELLHLFCPRHECEYRVMVTDPSEQRAAEIQQELAAILFAGADDGAPA